ncbi:MAG TPA: NAD(P)H-binding protein [Telluria sp.]|nr:NAD(P)H-binding protein [Telluria sp.]
MNLALIGATGFVGTALRTEALSRGHRVSAIARNAAGIEAHANLRPTAIDLANGAALVDALRGADAALVAVRYHGTDVAAVLDAVRAAGVPRVLFMGGAGSLKTPGGADLLDTPEFPALYKDEATAARAFLRSLRADDTVEWSYLSPSAMLLPGARSGSFRLGLDELLVDADGGSSITVGDLAAAALDEIETPTHSRRRFTAGY